MVPLFTTVFAVFTRHLELIASSLVPTFIYMLEIKNEIWFKYKLKEDFVND